MKRNTFCVALALAAAGCTNMTAQIKAGGQLAQGDTDFATTAYQIADFDSQESKLAAARASDPRVTDVSSQIVAQTGVFTPDLRDDLTAEGARPPALGADMAAKVQALRAMKGAAFDRQYVADQVAAHQQVLQLLQKEDSSSQNATLKSQAETIMPAVQDDLNKLQYLSGDFVQTHS